MSDYINGSSYPIFKIYNSSDVLVDTIALNLCDEKGLTETYEFIKITHDLLNYSIVQKVKGFHLNFELSYESWSKKEHSMKIARLFDYIINTNDYKFILTPRVDVLNRYFEVINVNDSLTINIMRNGLNAIGNKGINLQFKTKWLGTNLQWVDPTDLNIAIEDFVTLG